MVNVHYQQLLIGTTGRVVEGFPTEFSFRIIADYWLILLKWFVDLCFKNHESK